MSLAGWNFSPFAEGGTELVDGVGDENTNFWKRGSHVQEGKGNNQSYAVECKNEYATNQAEMFELFKTEIYKNISLKL